MNAGAQSAHAFIENNGRGKPNFSSFGRITAHPDYPKTGVTSGLATNRQELREQAIPSSVSALAGLWPVVAN